MLINVIDVIGLSSKNLYILKVSDIANRLPFSCLEQKGKTWIAYKGSNYRYVFKEEKYAVVTLIAKLISQGINQAS
jgi:hypothetical protein